MLIDRAEAADTPSIERLLAESALPLDGAAQAFRTGVVARVGDRIVGAAAVEPYDEAGLLRSVVVAEDMRRTGIGASVVAASETLSRALGIDELYLLTETAEAWFAHRGYGRIERDDFPSSVRGSIEFTSACSDTAVAMKRRLGS